MRFTGGGTKVGWGAAGPEHALELPTAGLDRILEHNAGDLTAVLEAGVPLARAQEAFAEEGQMLALDPPDGGATLGGVVATADSGPLRGRYGGVRDLVVGMRVALSDGTLAKSGGKVIKNVAGYDLAKLFAGSLGTLGAIVEVSVRLHPLQPASATAIGRAAGADELGRALITVSRAPLEHSGFDVRWTDGGGALLVRFAGVTPRPQAEFAERLLREAGLDTEIDGRGRGALDGAARAPARGRARGGRAARLRPADAAAGPDPGNRGRRWVARRARRARALVAAAARTPRRSRSTRCVASFIPPPASSSTGRPRSRWIRGAPSTRPCSRSCAG